MAWGVWNKIKNGLKKAWDWVHNKILKPVGRFVSGAWTKVVKPVVNIASKIPGIDKIPGPVGVVGKVVKVADKFSPVIDIAAGLMKGNNKK